MQYTAHVQTFSIILCTLAELHHLVVERINAHIAPQNIQYDALDFNFKRDLWKKTPKDFLKIYIYN